MRITPSALGQHFGQLAYIRGLITFKLSPFEQRAFAGIERAIPRTFFRIRSSIFKVAPPFLMGWMVYHETETKFEKMCRKNPEDYINDK